LVIENYKGILEYEDYYIKLETYMGIVNINGVDLKLEKMTEDNLKITGKIGSIDVERK
jgi:sporulation protein YqfC